MDMREVRGKQALVTGAASGIGRAIALRLAREGVRLCLLDVNEAGLDETAREARQGGVEVLAWRCDVSELDQIRASTEQLLGRWGGVDILVNNAGVCLYGPTASMSVEQWDWITSINLQSHIRFTQLLLPSMLARPEAHIVNVCSMFGLFGMRRLTGYCTTKAGLMGFSEALRAEVAREGIGVTALCPGFVSTNLFAAAPCTQESRQTPHPPWYLRTSAERIGEQTLRAIRRNQFIVLATPLCYLVYYLKRFTPGLVYWSHTIDRRRALQKKQRRLAELAADAARQRRAA